MTCLLGESKRHARQRKRSRSAGPGDAISMSVPSSADDWRRTRTGSTPSRPPGSTAWTPRSCIATTSMPATSHRGPKRRDNGSATKSSSQSPAPRWAIWLMPTAKLASSSAGAEPLAPGRVGERRPVGLQLRSSHACRAARYRRAVIRSSSTAAPHSSRPLCRRHTFTGIVAAVERSVRVR